MAFAGVLHPRGASACTARHEYTSDQRLKTILLSSRNNMNQLFSSLSQAGCVLAHQHQRCHLKTPLTWLDVLQCRCFRPFDEVKRACSLIATHRMACCCFSTALPRQTAEPTLLTRFFMSAPHLNLAGAAAPPAAAAFTVRGTRFTPDRSALKPVGWIWAPRRAGLLEAMCALTNGLEMALGATTDGPCLLLATGATQRAGRAANAAILHLLCDRSTLACVDLDVERIGFT